MTARATPIRVLHVDDDPAFADLATTFLEREDDRFDTTTATSAADGLDAIADGDVDCVVSDYDMPGRNGIEFLEAVRETSPDLPFVLFTGKGSEEIASDAISAGVTDYLQKDTGTSQYLILANRIRNAVETYRNRRERDRRIERQQRQREALFDLTTDDAVAAGDFDVAIRRITETAADVLAVDRVNAWLFADDHATLRCVDHYDRRTDAHDSGMELEAADYPEYFAALENGRSIDAHDARADSRTAALTDDYLAPNDVGALLDGTLRSGGDVVGMVCHEHVGGTRSWADDEVQFAGNVADVVHRALRNRRRNERERRLEAIFENAFTFTGLVDLDGTVLEANETALSFGGVDREEVVGEPLWETYRFQVSEESRETARTAVDRARSGELFRTTLPVQGADGETVVDFSVRPVTDEAGEVTELIPEGRLRAGHE